MNNILGGDIGSLYRFDKIFQSTRIEHSLTVGGGEDLLDTIDNYMKDYGYLDKHGFFYISTTHDNGLDVALNHSTGIVVHRNDTIGILLIPYSSKGIAINQGVRRNDVWNWLGWTHLK